MRTEAEILRDLSDPRNQSRTAQRTLAKELTEMQFETRMATQNSRALDLAHTAVQDRFAPTPVHSRVTAASDWLEDVANATPSNYDDAIRATAAYWYQQVSEAVRADPEEFSIQAEGKARREASIYGEERQSAQQTFLDHVNRLQRQAGYKIAAPGENQSGEAVSGVPDVQERTPDDEGQDDLTHFPDTGPAEVPSTRAPNVKSAGENPKSDGKAGEIADDSGVAQSGVPDANEDPDETPSQEWIDPPIPSGAADVKNVRNPNDHTSMRTKSAEVERKFLEALREAGVPISVASHYAAKLGEVDWLGDGQTPTQGPGTPPPNEGQADPARGDGPAPYNAAPPAGGTPAVADQARVLNAPVNPEGGAPGGMPIPTAVQAFRQRVQASLQSQAGNPPPWLKDKKKDDDSDDGSKPDAPSGSAPPDKAPADDPNTNAPDAAADTAVPPPPADPNADPAADPNADPNADTGHDNPNPVQGDPPNVQPGGTVSVDVGGQALSGTYVGVEDGYWAVDAGSLHLLLDSGVNLSGAQPQQQNQSVQPSGASGTQAPNQQ